MDSMKHQPGSAAPLLPAGLIVLAVLALASSLMMFGCGGPTPTPEVPTATATPTPDATQIALWTDTPPPGSPTPTTPTPTASPTPCPSPPAGWVPYTVQPGDTLSELAMLAGVTQEQVLEVNCLTSSELMGGQVLFLPPLPTPTPCGTVPAGWVPYTVQPGDTLFRLASLAGVSQDEVMQVNCLASRELIAGQSLYLPPLPKPTPTPCVPSPLAGWVPYTVRSGDTLFGLAVTRGTTTEEVMRANCLTSSSIIEGDLLYLPPLPVSVEPPSTSPPGQPPSEGGVAELPEWELDIGKPSTNAFKACHPAQASPWVDMLPPVWPPPSDPDHRDVVQLGERRFFFACGFTATEATVRMSDGTAQPVAPVTTLPNLDLEMNTAQSVIDWPVLPTDPVGHYTVIMTDTNGITASTSFTVTMPTKAYILAVPSANPPGTPFDLYFVNFEQDVAHDIAFCRAEETKERSYEPISCDRRAVQMDEVRNGGGEIWWAQEGWTVEATSLPVPLAVVAYDDTDRYALFWLR